MSQTVVSNSKSLLAEAVNQELALWYSLHRLQERYISIIDTDRLEEWPELFMENGVYEIFRRRMLI